MSFSSSTTDTVTLPGLSIKKFESQSEVDEKKRKRQEEWEKVRKPEDPTEFPEEPVDSRCLYDKLEEQRLKKQEEFEEQTAFKNQIKRLDEDEVEFLDFVSERQQELSREKTKEEAEIMSELKTAQVVKVADPKPEEKKTKPAQQMATKRSQSALLSGAVRKKRPDESSPSSKKPRLSSAETADSQGSQKDQDNSVGNSDNTSTQPNSHQTDNVPSDSASREVNDSKPGSNAVSSVSEVIAVLPSVLPGMNQYEDSTDSQSSSSDSEPDFNIGSVFATKMQQSR